MSFLDVLSQVYPKCLGELKNNDFTIFWRLVTRYFTRPSLPEISRKGYFFDSSVFGSLENFMNCSKFLRCLWSWEFTWLELPLSHLDKKNLEPLVSKLHPHFQENFPVSTERTTRSHTKTTKKKKKGILRGASGF